ncbi:MAG: peptide ABC transporter substrate-binding protein [Chlamydiales bacterium]
MSLQEQKKSLLSFCLDPSLHISYLETIEKLEQWNDRFPHKIKNSLFNDLCFFYLHNTKEYLTLRSPWHIFRLILSIHLMKEKLSYNAAFHPNKRHLDIRCIYSALTFPFISKSVLGCLVGCNLFDRYEIFDKENILLTLQKYIPDVSYVKESLYQHPSKDENLKIIYLELEKENPISLQERCILQSDLERKMKSSIQRLSPMVFMASNREEIYKTLVVLNGEIQVPDDLPQVYISLDKQTDKEIIFRVHLVQIAPAYPISWNNLFLDCNFVSEYISTLKKLKNHDIQAHIFRLHFPRESKLLRSDGSLIFYAARQKVVTALTKALGEFRDFNGGIFYEQQELFQEFKKRFPKIAETEIELMETFFYSIMPEEKQLFISTKTLSILFTLFLKKRKEILPSDISYSFEMYLADETLVEDIALIGKEPIFIIIRGVPIPTIKETIIKCLQKEICETQDKTYNILETEEGIFFNCILFSDGKGMIETLRVDLLKLQEKIQESHTLKIALEFSPVSLDPRIGGDVNSRNILIFLLEGLVRFGMNGQIENGVAEHIEISPDCKTYTFSLRRTHWNDGSLVSAYDFEYSWKKVLSPDFQTAFAYFFYPIKNAKEAKEGKCLLDDVGIQVIDEQTLKVSLVRPTPYFLELTAHTLYSPIHRHIDRRYPQWPYASQKNYPCNGAFQLKINEPNHGYYIVRNPFYKNKQGVFWDQVILTYMNATQAFQSFQKKEIDWIGNPFGSWHPHYNSPEGQVLSFPNSCVYWFVFNTNSFPFNNLTLRQAFAYAIQREPIVSDCFLSLTPAYSPLPFSHMNPNTFFPDYNKKKATQLFEEALQELDISREDFPNIEIIFQKQGVREYTANHLQQQLKECFGVTCTPKALDCNLNFDKLTKGDFTIGLVHWHSWIDDPIYTLNAFKFSKERMNLAKWEHPEFQCILDCSEKTSNLFQRSSYLLNAEKILCREMPIIPLFYQPSQVMIQKELQASCTNDAFNFIMNFKKKETL